MTHDEIRSALFLMADGVLTNEEKNTVGSHLPACASCRRALEQWPKISTALFPHTSISEAQEDRVVTAVMERIRVQARPHFLSSTNLLRWVFPLVGSAMAAAWVFFYIMPSTPELSSLPSSETDYYSSSTPEALSSQWEAMPASYHDDMVVSMIKE
jgi:anti-sigma factor RsiW